MYLIMVIIYICSKSIVHNVLQRVRICDCYVMLTFLHSTVFQNVISAPLCDLFLAASNVLAI